MFEFAHRLSMWADDLNANPHWVEAINTAFDDIGFTDEYVKSCKAATSLPPRTKVIKDSVWGMIELDPSAVWLINSPIFQRLRCVRQLGFSYLTYPNAQHTRFEHSLGVYYVVLRLLDSFRLTYQAERKEQQLYENSEVAALEVSDRDSRLIRHAALLHDIGHSAFSHVSEKAFTLRAGRWTIGPYTIEEFLNTFAKYYRGLKGARQVVDVQGNKKLTEIVAAAMIMTTRFRRFYATAPTVPPSGIDSDIFDVAALILGDRISSNNLALPAVLSGPVDADKIDYMIRDAQACGISLSIDVSRVFLRAGVYKVARPKLLPNSEQIFGLEDRPVTIFVIDQAGSDAVREMGMSRLSLYGRVYHHQLTRNAEMHFRELLDTVAPKKKRRERSYSDWFRLWSLPEQVLVQQLSTFGRDATVRKLGRQLRERRLLVRSACLNHKIIHSPMPEWLDELPEVGQAIGIEIDNTFAELSSRVEEEKAYRALCRRIVEECTTIRRTLLKANVPKQELPREAAPERIAIIPFPVQAESQPPTAYIMSADRRITRSDTRLQSYFHAGEIPEHRSFLLAPPEWREIAALAFQKTLFNEFFRKYEADLVLPAIDVGELPDRQINLTWTVNGFHRPVQDVFASCHESKVSVERTKKFQTRLIAKRYYDKSSILCPANKNEIIYKELGKKFRHFQGEAGWQIDPDGLSVAAFVSQFPPSLRSHLISLLQSLEFLDRATTAQLLLSVVKKLATANTSNTHLVPLTPSSGHLMFIYMKSEIQKIGVRSGARLHANIRDALDVVRGKDQIVFFDDNIASGVQACKQIEALSKGRKASPANIFHAKLPKRDLRVLKEKEVGFAFAVGTDRGVTSLVEKARELGFKVGGQSVRFARNLEEISGKGTTDPDLRTFLKVVGRGVLLDQIPRQWNRAKREAAIARVAKRALGYDQLEGMIVTAFNVPTSTYTALWCPGSYFPSATQAKVRGAQPLPWLPLFIRTGMFRHLVLP